MGSDAANADILHPYRTGEGPIENTGSKTAPSHEGHGGSGEDTPSDESLSGESPAGGAGGGGFPLLVVKTGSVRCGIAVDRVREVVRSRRMARIPDSRAPLRGLLSVRGEVVTVVDLEGLRDLLSGGKGGPEMSETGGVTTGSIRPGRVEAVVVLRGGRDPIGLEVDGVEDIRDFAGAGGGSPGGGRPGSRSGRPDPESLSATTTFTGRIWAGVVRDARGEIGVLDADLLQEAVEALAGQDEEPAILGIPGGDGPAAPEPGTPPAGAARG